MADVDTLLAFALASVLFAYMPGPALLYTAAQTISRGRSAGLSAALGIHLGCYVHVFAAAFGLSAIFLAVPTLYAAMKVLGGAYLIWLGIQMIRSRIAGNEADVVLPPKSRQRSFLDSILVEVLNPKVALFFIAFLPQFVAPEGSLPIWLQFLILGTVVNFSFTSADLLVVFFASSVRDRLSRSSRWQDLTRWIGGTVLMGLGLKLATERG
ncbi:LysE family translocator [Roseibium sp.]|uniref:LysE family translocator n=1 Tax=Roseibium sp. TaxID=1936156 RepID=UPI003A9872FF